MQNKHASATEVAKLAGVSAATVSYVLNNRRNQTISPATRQRVLDAAQALQYRPNRLANGVLRGKSDIIGIVAGILNNEYHSNVLTGVCDALSKAGYHSFVSRAESKDTVLREIDLMIEHRVDGMVLMCETGEWLRQKIACEHVPSVIIDSRDFADVADCVVSDDIAGTRAAIDHLIGLGHRRIGFWTYAGDGSPYRDRRTGYEIALSAAGIDIDGTLVRSVPEPTEQYSIALRDWLDEPNPPTAIFCMVDMAAMFVRRACEEIGMRVPDDLAIVGYSNQVYSHCADLTTVDQYPRTLGKLAVERLLQRIEDPSKPTGVQYIPTELIVRSSTVALMRRRWFESIK